MRFTTPPECQGQIVEVSYACAGDTLLQRVHDRSDRSTSYYSAEISDDDWTWYEGYQPANGAPPSHLEWSPMSEAQVLRLEED